MRPPYLLNLKVQVLCNEAAMDTPQVNLNPILQGTASTSTSDVELNKKYPSLNLPDFKAAY
jgi:hypothetical protein